MSSEPLAMFDAVPLILARKMHQIHAGAGAQRGVTSEIGRHNKIEAVRCLAEQGGGSGIEIILGSRVGIGFLAHRCGVLRFTPDLGTKRWAARQLTFAKVWRPQLDPAASADGQLQTDREIAA